MESFVARELAGKVRSDRDGEYWALEDLVKHFCPETPSRESIGWLLMNTDVIHRYCTCSPIMPIEWREHEKPESSVCHVIRTKYVPILVSNLPGDLAAQFMSRLEAHQAQIAAKTIQVKGRYSTWERIRQILEEVFGRIGFKRKSVAHTSHLIG